jgi:hypothetical protein
VHRAVNYFVCVQCHFQIWQLLAWPLASREANWTTLLPHLRFPMSASLEHLLREAKSLSSQERDILLAALASDADAHVAEAAWDGEIGNRIDEIKGGKVTLLDHGEFISGFAQARAEVRRLRMSDEPIRETAWPEGYFDSILVGDEAFSRPDQGTIPLDGPIISHSGESQMRCACATGADAHHPF